MSCSASLLNMLFKSRYQDLRLPRSNKQEVLEVSLCDALIIQSFPWFIQHFNGLYVGTQK